MLNKQVANALKRHRHSGVDSQVNIQLFQFQHSDGTWSAYKTKPVSTLQFFTEKLQTLFKKASGKIDK